jgi:WD40 repeat protein
MVEAPKPPCDQAAELRVRVPKLYAEGRLDRTVRAIRRADLLCPATAPETWPTLIDTLVTLGRYDEAHKAIEAAEAVKDRPAASLEATKSGRERLLKLEKLPADAETAKRDAAKLVSDGNELLGKGDALRAKRRFLEAWDTFHPNGEALYGAAIATRTLGDPIETQRLFDRAIVDLEKRTGAHLELDVVNGFDGFVNGIAWAPAGDVLVIANGTVVSVREASSLRDRYRLRGHTAAITSIAIARDGKTVISGGKDSTAILWDVTTGLELRRFEGHAGVVTSVAFAPDGKTVATASVDDTVRLWSTSNGALIGTLSHPLSVAAVRFSPDGRALATACEDHVVRVWDPTTRALSYSLTGHPTAVSALAWSNDAKTLASGGADGSVRTWDASKHAVRSTIEAHEGEVTALAIAPDGKTLASASIDETVRTWSLPAGGKLRTMPGHAVMARAVAFSPDGKHLASGAYNGFYLWNAGTGREERRVEGHASAVSAVAFSPDGTKLATGSRDDRVRIWSTGKQGERVRSLVGHTGVVTALAYARTGFLASGATDRTVRLWDVDKGVDLRVIEDVGYVQSLAIAPDGGRIAAATLDRWVAVYNTTTGASQSFPVPSGVTPSVYGVAWSHDGSKLAIGLADRSARVLEATSGKELARLDGHGATVLSVAFSPDDKLLASGSYDKTVRLWDVEGRKNLGVLAGGTDAVTAVAFRPSGTSLVSASRDGTIHVFSTADGTAWKETMKIRDHTDAILALAVRDDGAWMATGGLDATTRLYTLPDAQPRLTLRALAGMAEGHAVARDGSLEFLPDQGAARAFPICSFGPVSMPFELCAERFVAKDLIPRVLAGDTSYMLP